MTRREFDKATKVNWNADRSPDTSIFLMASDERANYRATRMRGDCLRRCSCRRCREPLLERRAAYLQRYGQSPLALGSPMRAPAIWRALKRLPAPLPLTYGETQALRGGKT